MADLVEGATGLEAAERIARRDLARLNYPPANWVPERFGPDGKRVLDVLVVGAGMCGQTAGWNLLREGIRNIRVIERNFYRREGPWNTTARMPILRSPKHLTGPDLGVPSLTFRAWYEAQHGSAGWEALYKVKRLDWMDYLLWVRKVVDLPVENGVALERVEPAGKFLKTTLSTGEQLHVRKLVLANGRDGSGGFKWPRFPSFDPDSPKRAGKVFHTLEEIDFGKFVGKRIGVLGVLATAIDNTATALEAGAREAICYARRPHLPQVNKSKGASFPGFQRGQGMLDDDWRWKIYTYMLSAGSPPPHESVLRVQKLPGFSFRFSEPWLDVIVDGDGVTVKTTKSVERFDVVLMGTGFDVDMSRRPEFAAFASNIKIWGDTRSPEDAKANGEAALYPYLGPGFELMEKEPGRTPLLSDIHLFNWGSILSQGALAGDIPGLFVGSPRLVQAISHSLFRADVAQHAENMFNQEDPELAPTDYYVPREKRSGTL
ncbi:MAG: NAD(P)/FAD-dependent oxidoreductase [Reyranella sp.]|uniref:FAD/NAD(P)-binding protein n=1 Tax=Reyranella sp. TaxID=1929291 RepID=UPI001ACBB553|nr:NAD(P)/FAD-dependent oxidoreductase [Reyranella sp.]MBN9089343.1 NAD(P)/FAD-dependent oxidoreductase [Reyranella sp.]